MSYFFWHCNATKLHLLFKHFPDRGLLDVTPVILEIQNLWCTQLFLFILFHHIPFPLPLSPHFNYTCNFCQTFTAEVRRELKTLLALSTITCPRPSHPTAPSRAGRTGGRSTALPPRPRRRWADSARPGTAHSSRPWARVQLPSQIGAQGYLLGAARIMRGRGPAHPGGRVC